METITGNDHYHHLGYYDGNRDDNEALEALILSGTINDAARDGINATNQNGNANIRETSRVGSDVSRDIFNSHNSISREQSASRAAIERMSGESRLQSAIDTQTILTNQQDMKSDLRNDVKEASQLVLQEGCKTRETLSEQHCDIKVRMTEQHGDLKLQMCKDHADLVARIEKCCCEQSKQAAETRALILATDTKRVEAENADLRQQLMVAQLQKGN